MSSPHLVPELKGGMDLKPALTPGGHIATTSQSPAFPDFHRKFADPSPFAWLGLGACFVMQGMVFVEANKLSLRYHSVVIAPAAGLGFLMLTIATIIEYLSGRTFAATMFGVYGGYWGGFLVLNVPWFGLTGSYTGTTPNIYAPGGAAANELNSVTGIWLSTFVILTFFFIVGATRQSATVLATLVSMELFFILAMCFYFTEATHTSLAKAAGAFGILTGLFAWYDALAALCTPSNAWFTLPTFEFVGRDR